MKLSQFLKKGILWHEGLSLLNSHCRKTAWEKGYINIYHFEDSDIRTKYRYKSFSEYNEEWLDFILACRTGSKEYLNYDIYRRWNR